MFKYSLVNKLRNKLKKKYSVGAWMQLGNSSVAEIISCSGYDWVAIDMEHGSISINQLPDLFRAIINKTKSLPFVRTYTLDPHVNQRLLDAGAAGIIFPRIDNAVQVKNLVKFLNFYPIGNRGIGFSISNNFGNNLLDQIRNFKPFIVIMIESLEGVKNLNEILKVKRIDAVLIGPYDLSASMNLLGKFSSKKFTSVIDRILSECRKSKIPCGLHIVDADKNNLLKKIKKGFKFLAYGMDTEILKNYYKYPLNF